MMKNIATALVKAQMNMGKAAKTAANPHLRSKYADLGSVMDACVPALNEAGIAVLQPAGEDDTGRYVETIFIHGESGEQLSCKVPLIVQKNDMQGYGSAVTYARRYGLMTMAGIAPEDDDGNAASKASPPKQQQRKPDPAVEPPKEPEQTPAQSRDKLKGALNKQTDSVTLEKLWDQDNFKAAFDALTEPMQNEIKAVYTDKRTKLGGQAN